MRNVADQLDSSIEIVTPENIAFRYRVAGPFRRLPAYLIDLALRVAIVFAGFIVTGMFGLTWVGPVLFGITLVAWFLLAWFYGGVCETLFNGQTPGKRLMGIRVVSIDGQPINAMQAVLRNVLRAIDAQPLWFYQLGLLAAAMNDRFQRLGDLASGTMVVVEERPWLDGVTRINDAKVARLAAQVPANFEPSRTLARALTAYVQRRRGFSWGRRLEIARHLAEPLREKFRLAPDTNPDLLLCALYHRVFITDRYEEPAAAASPFRQPAVLSENPLSFLDDPLVTAQVRRT
jgi:uncharacterized RDD family membrane protein YckC